MKAILKRGTNRAELGEIEKKIGKGNTRIRTLRVGIDGTDREVLNKEDGKPYPENDDFLVMGHEAVGRVEESEKFSKDTLVVPTVRRPTCGCDYARKGRSDLCPEGHYQERGIEGLHGFGCEEFFEKDDNLVEIPEELEKIGVLVEPLSIFEKAFSEIKKAQERISFEPENCLVLGAGSIGLLSAMGIRKRGLDLTVMDIVSEKHPKAGIVEDIGGTYHNNRHTGIEEIGKFDLIIEASGVSEQIVEGVKALKDTGAMVSLGLPRRKKVKQCDIGEFHEQLVRGNKLLIGSVNSSREHYRKAVDELSELMGDYPIENIIDTSVPPEAFMKSFMPRIKGEIVFQD